MTTTVDITNLGSLQNEIEAAMQKHCIWRRGNGRLTLEAVIDDQGLRVETIILEDLTMAKKPKGGKGTKKGC